MPRRYCIRALEDTRATSRDVIGRGSELKWLLAAYRNRFCSSMPTGCGWSGGTRWASSWRRSASAWWSRATWTSTECWSSLQGKKDRKNNSDKSHWESVNCVRSQRRGPDALRILWLNCDIETETSASLFYFLLLFCTFGHYLRCEKPNKYWLEQDNPWARIWNVAANQMNVTAVRPKKVFMDFVKMIIICHHCKVMYSPSSTNKMNGFQPNMDLWSG